MKLLEPAIQLIGTLSFRNKLRVTAIVFGLPLLIALGLILNGINERVAKLQEEREALSVQIPTLSLMSSLHQYLAASRAYRDGDESLQAMVKSSEADARAALKKLQAEMAQHSHLTGKLTTNQVWLDNLNADIKQIGELTQGDELGELQSKITGDIRNELDKLNEDAGLLVDSDTASSRLIDILTAQIPELIDTAGKTASIGGSVLVNQRIKNRARLDLTLLRGNFNSRVDTLKGSAHANMKELRFDASDGVWRVAFAFDPDRQAILLVAGDKSGTNEKRFYKRLIAKAEERLGDHLAKRKERKRK